MRSALVTNSTSKVVTTTSGKLKRAGAGIFDGVLEVDMIVVGDRGCLCCLGDDLAGGEADDASGLLVVELPRARVDVFLGAIATFAALKRKRKKSDTGVTKASLVAQERHVCCKKSTCARSSEDFERCESRTVFYDIRMSRVVCTTLCNIFTSFSLYIARGPISHCRPARLTIVRRSVQMHGMSMYT